MKLKRLLVSISIVIISTCFSMAQVTAPSGGESFSLEQLKDSALQHNIAMRKGRLKIAAAKEQRKEAFTKYFPNISAVGMTFRANREMAEMSIDPQEMLSPETKAALAELAPMMAQILPPEVLAGFGNPVTMSMMVPMVPMSSSSGMTSRVFTPMAAKSSKSTGHCATTTAGMSTFLSMSLAL